MDEPRDSRIFFHGFAWASIEWALVTFALLMAFAVIAYRRKEPMIAIVMAAMGILCCPGLPFGLVFGLAIGWRYARVWQIRTFMTFWTASVVIAIFNWSVYLVLRMNL